MGGRVRTPVYVVDRYRSELLDGVVSFCLLIKLGKVPERQDELAVCRCNPPYTGIVELHG